MAEQHPSECNLQTWKISIPRCWRCSKTDSTDLCRIFQVRVYKIPMHPNLLLKRLALVSNLQTVFKEMIHQISTTLEVQASLPEAVREKTVVKEALAAVDLEWAEEPTWYTSTTRYQATTESSTTQCSKRPLKKTTKKSLR